MASKAQEISGSIRDGAADVKERVQDAAESLADKVEEVLDQASDEGKRVAKRVRKELAKRWQVVDRTGRDNAFVMAIGALAVGVLVGYLIGRDRD